MVDVMKFNEQKSKVLLQQLCDNALIRHLPDTPEGRLAREYLLQKVNLHRYHKNDLIFVQHTKAQYLHFLLEGQVGCYRQLPNGQESLIQSYQVTRVLLCPSAAKLINESVLWRTTPSQPHSTQGNPPLSHVVSTNLQLLVNDSSLHQLTARATTACVMASLPAKAFFECIGRFELGEMFAWFAEQVSMRLYQHLIASDLLAFKSARAKLAYYLLTNFSPNAPFEFGGSQKQLAAKLGLRPETFNRTLYQLLKEGVLTKSGAYYQMIDSSRLLHDINK